MPIHDWKRVNAGIFHHFHNSWIEEIARFLNRGQLPRGYYALAEQMTGDFGPDVLTLQLPVDRSLSASPNLTEASRWLMRRRRSGFTPGPRFDIYAAKAKTVVIRHRSRHQIIAMVEIVSPGEQEWPDCVRRLRSQSRSSLAFRHPSADRRSIPADGMRSRRHPSGDLGQGRRRGFRSAGRQAPDLRVLRGLPGSQRSSSSRWRSADSLPDMPLFLTRQVYVPVPLEATYSAAWEALPISCKRHSPRPINGRKKPGRGRKKK